MIEMKNMLTFADLRRLVTAQRQGRHEMYQLPVELQALGCDPTRMQLAMVEWASRSLNAAQQQSLAEAVNAVFPFYLTTTSTVDTQLRDALREMIDKILAGYVDADCVQRARRLLDDPVSDDLMLSECRGPVIRIVPDVDVFDVTKQRAEENTEKEPR